MDLSLFGVRGSVVDREHRDFAGAGAGQPVTCAWSVWRLVLAASSGPGESFASAGQRPPGAKTVVGVGNLREGGSEVLRPPSANPQPRRGAETAGSGRSQCRSGYQQRLLLPTRRYTTTYDLTHRTSAGGWGNLIVQVPGRRTQAPSAATSRLARAARGSAAAPHFSGSGLAERSGPCGTFDAHESHRESTARPRRRAPTRRRTRAALPRGGGYVDCTNRRAARRRARNGSNLGPLDRVSVHFRFCDRLDACGEIDSHPARPPR
jgi:hypothetical protein